MRVGVASAWVVAGSLYAGVASGQVPKVGDRVECNGNTGVVVGTQPRAGWNEPFFIVRVPMGSSTYDLKCLSQQMRARPGDAAPAPPPVPAAVPAAPAAAPVARAPAVSVAPPARAQPPANGSLVNCGGHVGTIVRTEPRPGWEEPFSIVRVPMGSSSYELKCLAQHMKPAEVSAAAAAALQQGIAPTVAACQPGAKLEGRKGISWYEVTVLAAPDANGWCPVRFDGFGASNDASVPELRARGSGPIVRPDRRVADGPPPGAAAGGAVPDGTYSCSKIEGGGGNYLHMGNATIRGGRVTSLGLPAGWSVRSVALGPPNGFSRTVAEITYQTASGNTDKLECIPR
ncbi:MAG: hypothetical protein Q8R63_07265 [Ramlibacter sp.]|nr:hypothetical protein [Ramlibacter sp.]